MNIEKTIKQRFRRAIRAAQRILSYPEGSARVIELNNHVFHLEAIRPKEIRKIRVVLDKSTKEDVELVRNYPLPENCTKEIWCRNKRGYNIKCFYSI